MRRFYHCLLVGLIALAVLGCEPKKQENRPAVEGEFAPPPGTPDPKLQPKLPTPPAPGPGEPDYKLMEKESAALKTFNMIIFPDSGGLEVKVDDPCLVGGKMKPELLEVLKKTTTLTGLSFQFAREFTDAGMEDVKDFTKLKSLHVHGTKVTDAGMAHVKGMTKLEKVMLSDTGITDKGLENLKGVELKEIDVGTVFGKKRDITDAGLGQLKLGKLARVQISGTKITDAGLALLKDSKGVGILWASNCDITDKGLEHLKPLTGLSWLKLENTKITDAGLVHLESLPALTTLEVDGTAVTKDGAAKLQAKLPKCRIKGTEFELPAK